MSEHKITSITTPEAPAAIGPYSQAVRCGDLLFLSGQIPLNPGTMTIVGDTVEAQAEQVMKNLRAVLAAQGIGFENVVKTTVYMRNLGEFGKFNEVYGKFLKAPYPARATVEVSRLPKDVLVEIEAVAYCPR